MTDGQERSATTWRDEDAGAVTSLASQALSLLATRRVPRDERFMADLMEKLEVVVLDRDPDKRIALMAEFRRLKISDEQIVDTFIPEVARRLGAAWCEDSMSFADVTIGSARLQSMVRDLSPNECSDGSTSVPLIGLVVPGEETHTLGAMVLIAQLRRKGYAVRLFVGKDNAQVAAVMADDQFDAVFISASHTEKLVNLGILVKEIRQVVSRATPIVVGGSVVARGTAIEARVGADFVTSDLEEALSACGLKTIHKMEKRHEMTGAMNSPNS